MKSKNEEMLEVSITFSVYLWMKIPWIVTAILLLWSTIITRIYY